MILRKADHEDWPSILDAAISTEVFSEKELECLEEDFEASFWDNSEFLVAEDKGEILGFAQVGELEITSNAWCLYWISVTKEAQGKGVGRKLVAKIENICKKNDARLIFIETSSKVEYENTRAFYSKCGYAAVCTIPSYYGQDDDKVIFSKTLDLKGIARWRFNVLRKWKQILI